MFCICTCSIALHNTLLYIAAKDSLGHKFSASVLNLVNLEMVGLTEPANLGHDVVNPVLLSLDVVLHKLRMERGRGGGSEGRRGREERGRGGEEEGRRGGGRGGGGREEGGRGGGE